MINPFQYANKSEHSLQVSLFMWTNMAARYGFKVADDISSYNKSQSELDEENGIDNGIYSLRWLHAVPNGGKRDSSVAASLKAEGVKPGVADIFWPLPKSKWHGLYIEFKAPGKLENTSLYQRAFRLHCVDNGYAYFVFDDWRDAASCVRKYYEGKI